MLVSAAQAAEKQDLVVVTSYPPSFFEPFRQAFEKANPDIRTSIVQRNTASATRFGHAGFSVRLSSQMRYGPPTSEAKSPTGSW